MYFCGSVGIRLKRAAGGHQVTVISADEQVE